VVCGAGAGVFRSAAPRDAAPSPRSSSTMNLGVFGLYLLSSLGSPPPPINYRWVEDDAESACS
jgi:hypothetical protein